MRAFFGLAAAAFCAPVLASPIAYDFLDVTFSGEVLESKNFDGSASTCTSNCITPFDGIGRTFRVMLNRAPGDENPSGSVGDYTGPSFVQWTSSFNGLPVGQSHELPQSHDRVMLRDGTLDFPPVVGTPTDVFDISSHEEGVDHKSGRYVVDSLAMTVWSFNVDFLNGDELAQQFFFGGTSEPPGYGELKLGSRPVHGSESSFVGQWLTFRVLHVDAKLGSCKR